MKHYRVNFKQNGDEYVGFLKVACNNLKKDGNKTFFADNVFIEIDEDIIDIERLDANTKDQVKEE